MRHRLRFTIHCAGAGSVTVTRNISPEVMLEPGALALVVSQLRRTSMLDAKRTFDTYEGDYSCHYEDEQPNVPGWERWKPVAMILDPKHLGAEAWMVTL